MLLLISRLRDFTITLLLFFCVFQLSAQNNETVDSLSVVLSSAKADSTRVRLLFEIGRENWFARNFKDAARYLNQSVTLAVEENYFEHQADAYNLLANIFMKQESFDTAFAYLQKAWDQHDKRYLPLIHETYSKLYYQLGDYQSSLKYALMAVDGYKESPDPSINMQLVYAYLMVGDVFDRLKQSDRAMDYYQKAYLKGKTSGKNWYIKTPMQRIAGYYLLNRQFDRARHLYDTIIAIDQDAPSQEPTMHSHEGLGNIAMLEGNFKQAIA
ncbi:MAG: tetratricopeptide repeat protein, partial [Bacteroidota bacterium]